MNACLLIIGDEILIGQVLDTNSNWIASQLNLHGIRVNEIHTIPDTREGILRGLEIALNSDTQLILSTGGLGPTKDDITKKTLADYFGMELQFHEPSWESLKTLFARFNRVATDNYRPQCDMPVGATIIQNPVGTAPAMVFEPNGKIMICMPGVPSEMKYLVTNEVLPLLHRRFPQSPICHSTIMTVGIGETQLMEMIEEFEDNLPDYVKLAYLPYLGGVRLRLTARGADEESLKAELEQLKHKLVPIIDKYVFGYGEDSLESVVGKLLKDKSATVAVAESCSGGYLANRMISVPGASSYFQLGTVTYSNEMKIKMLDVSPLTLEQHGAVSEETVKEMVTGVLRLSGADYGVAISGIAGPDGGTPEKPVGMVCIAVGNQTDVKARTFYFGRDRKGNIELASTNALEFLRKILLEA